MRTWPALAPEEDIPARILKEIPKHHDRARTPDDELNEEDATVHHDATTTIGSKLNERTLRRAFNAVHMFRPLSKMTWPRTPTREGQPLETIDAPIGAETAKQDPSIGRVQDKFGGVVSEPPHCAHVLGSIVDHRAAIGGHPAEYDRARLVEKAANKPGRLSHRVSVRTPNQNWIGSRTREPATARWGLNCSRERSGEHLEETAAHAEVREEDIEAPLSLDGWRIPKDPGAAAGPHHQLSRHDRDDLVVRRHEQRSHCERLRKRQF